MAVNDDHNGKLLRGGLGLVLSTYIPIVCKTKKLATPNTVKTHQYCFFFLVFISVSFLGLINTAFFSGFFV